MLLWVGLGNPEPGMSRQRHNIGFMALDRIAQRHAFSPWKRRFKGETCEGSIGSTRIIGLKPMTYMNASGEAVQQAASFYKLALPAITAFHDELDLVAGKLRVKRGGGAAGHNGLRSMDRMLAGQDYWRVRLGIGHPGDKDRVLGHVLGDFAKSEQGWLTLFLDCVADNAGLLAEGQPETFMTRVALLMGEEKG